MVTRCEQVMASRNPYLLACESSSYLGASCADLAKDDGIIQGINALDRLADEMKAEIMHNTCNCGY